MGQATSKQISLLMIGLDGAGKTAIRFKLKQKETASRNGPTKGFNVEVINYNGRGFEIWDVGTGSNSRTLLRHYYHGKQGVVFVIDSTDRERLKEVAEELQYVVAEKSLDDSVILVLANKQDSPEAMKVLELIEKLGLKVIFRGRHWSILPISAASGEGLSEALCWLDKQF